MIDPLDSASISTSVLHHGQGNEGNESHGCYESNEGHDSKEGHESNEDIDEGDQSDKGDEDLCHQCKPPFLEQAAWRLHGGSEGARRLHGGCEEASYSQHRACGIPKNVST